MSELEKPEFRNIARAMACIYNASKFTEVKLKIKALKQAKNEIKSAIKKLEEQKQIL